MAERNDLASAYSIIAASDDKLKIMQTCMENDRQRLLMRYPFIGFILMHLSLVPITDDVICDTAMTDGTSVFMNEKFYEKLDLDERLFVLAHEAWHCVMLHFARRMGRDEELFNIAADLEIHFVLMQENLKEPFVLPHDPKWAGLSAEEIYERLLKGKKQLTSQRFSKGIHNTKGKPFDKHVYWVPNENSSDDMEQQAGGAGQENTENKSGDASGNQGEENGTRGKDGSAQSSADEKQQSNGSEQGNAQGKLGDASENQRKESGTRRKNSAGLSNGTNMNGNNAERIRQIVLQAAQMVEMQQGTLPSHIARLVETIHKPQLNWQELLKQFVTSTFNGSRRWLPPARRYIGMGLYLQSRRDLALEAVVALDTSGSMSEDLPKFFSELKSLLGSFGQYSLTVIQCDCKVQSVETFDSSRPLPVNHQWKAMGNGGTSFVPVFDYIKHKRLNPQLLIYLTDGLGPAPVQPPPYPVMWVLTHGRAKPTEWGRYAALSW